MTTYYKGTIFLASNNSNLHSLNVNIINNRIIPYKSNQFIKLINKTHYDLYKYDLANYIKTILYTGDSRIKEHAMHDILDNIFHQIPENIQGEIDIIYEIIEDNVGRKYGKELITGMIFPLYNENIRYFKYFVHLKDNCQKFWTPKFNDDLYILDHEDNQYLRNILYTKIKRKIVKRNEQYYIIYSGLSTPFETPITEATLEEYILTAQTTFQNNNYRICETMIKENGLASQEEIIEYKNNFENSTRYKVYIEILSSKNLLSEPLKIRTRK